MISVYITGRESRLSQISFTEVCKVSPVVSMLESYFLMSAVACCSMNIMVFISPSN